MKSAELFWNVIALYHGRYFNFELLMILAGISLTALLYWKSSALFSGLMKIYLSFSFGWLAVVFFWGLDKSPLGTFFVGPLFVAISVLFLIDLYFKNIEFALPRAGMQRMATFVLFALVLLYPLVSFLLGHRYPYITTPYLPCPLTVFALTLLSASLPRADAKVYILLLVWAMMALPKVFGLFDVREDTILFVAGVYSLGLLIKKCLDSFFIWPIIN